MGNTNSRVDYTSAVGDEVLALTLQLEEIGQHPSRQLVKNGVEDTSDSAMALSAYEKEIEQRMKLLKDTICAHSVARAISTDANAIAEIVQSEAQAESDRRLAIQMSNQGRTRSLKVKIFYYRYGSTPLTLSSKFSKAQVLTSSFKHSLQSSLSRILMARR
jgi:hypothetical protein